VTLIYDLLMSGELSFACPVHVPIFSILQLSVPELCVTQSDHITFTGNGHCTCAVSRDLSPRSKMLHIFEIPAHAQYHVTCAQGVPQNHT